MNRSVHLLAPFLSSLSPLSAFVSDVFLFSSVVPLTKKLNVPNYMFFTSSARMCSLYGSFPAFVASEASSGSIPFQHDIEIAGLGSIPASSIPPLLLNLNNLFGKIFLNNASNVSKSDGVLINSFEALEGEVVCALNEARAIDGFPHLFAIGPFLPCEFQKRGQGQGAELKWLDDQPEGSVVYVSFGSRTALSREQMKELGNGLVSSKCRFLWVVKDKKVDKEDGESLENMLGCDLMEKIKDQGLVVKDWVCQDDILSHKAVGGFVSHGGWNSTVEAAWNGVRVLMWPQFGDQKLNAEVVERSGWGLGYTGNCQS